MPRSMLWWGQGYNIGDGSLANDVILMGTATQVMPHAQLINEYWAQMAASWGYTPSLGGINST